MLLGDVHTVHGYDDESLPGAITDGLDPAGEPLGAAMPRWSMSRQDLDDLVACLQQTRRRTSPSPCQAS